MGKKRFKAEQIIRMLREADVEVASGKSQLALSKRTGVSQQAISRFANRSEIKSLIERETGKLYQKLPDMIEEINRDIETSYRISKSVAGELTKEETKELTERFEGINSMLKFKESIYKVKSDVLKALGVYPSQSPSIFVQNVFSDNKAAIIDPGVQRMIGAHVKELFGDNPLDENSGNENE